MPDSGRILLALFLCLAPAACGILRHTPATSPEASGAHASDTRDDWFCLANAGWDGWNCGRDPQLAQWPLPPRPARPAVAGTAPATEAATAAAGVIPAQAATARVPAPAAATAAHPGPVTPAAAAPPATPEPDWRHLAYHPATVLPLEELPAEFYAVQVVALSSMAALEDFRTAHRLSGVLGAQVESGGRVYYVLLLGVYETLADARAAAESRPESLQATTPWIRKLGTLQAAVMRAELLAGRTAE